MFKISKEKRQLVLTYDTEMTENGSKITVTEVAMPTDTSIAVMKGDTAIETLESLVQVYALKDGVKKPINMQRYSAGKTLEEIAVTNYAVKRALYNEVKSLALATENYCKKYNCTNRPLDGSMPNRTVYLNPLIFRNVMLRYGVSSKVLLYSLDIGTDGYGNTKYVARKTLDSVTGNVRISTDTIENETGREMKEVRSMYKPVREHIAVGIAHSIGLEPDCFEEILYPFFMPNESLDAQAELHCRASIATVNTGSNSNTTDMYKAALTIATLHDKKDTDTLLAVEDAIVNKTTKTLARVKLDNTHARKAISREKKRAIKLTKLFE